MNIERIDMSAASVPGPHSRTRRKRIRALKLARSKNRRQTAEREGFARITRERLGEFWNEMWWDCHGTTIKYSRSEKKNGVISLGPRALGEIADQLEQRYKGRYTGTQESPDDYWNEFWMWVCLIGAIFDGSKLRRPYSSDTHVGVMDMREWIAACRRGAK